MRHALAGIAIFFLLAGSFPREAAAHVPPPLYMTLEANEERLSFKAVIGTGLFRDWLPFDPEGLATADKEELARLKEAVEILFSESCRIRVDGLDVRGVFRSAELVKFSDDGIPWEYVNVTVDYGLKGRPRTIALAWRRFENSIGWYLEPIDAEMYAFGDGAYFSFEQDEPEYVWHAAEASAMEVLGGLPVKQRPAAGDSALIPVFLGLVGAFVLLAAIRPLLGISAKWFWLPAGVLGLSAIVAGLLGLDRMSRSREIEYAAPSEEEAGVIFETLHRNIYRAFDYEKEEDIYDTLAQSVTGDLLGNLYGEVYQGLILREEGGAVCRVQSTEILDRAVTLPEDTQAREFGVDCTWRVRGKVGHWGHTHVRVNEYTAKYLVAYQADNWKIAAMETLDHRRIDEER